MRGLLLVLLTSVSLAACDSGTKAPEDATPPAETSAPAPSDTAAAEEMTETQRINAWFAERFEEQLDFSPITKAFLGRKDDNDKIDDVSEAAEEAQLEWRRKSVEEMKASFDYDQLSDDAKISYDIWAYELERAERGVPFRHHQYIFHQMDGLHAFLPNFLMNFHSVADVSDMEAYIARIGGISRALNQLIERAKQASAEGIRPPKFAFELSIGQVEKLLSGAPFADSDEDAPLWADAKRKVAALVEQGTIDTAKGDELLEGARGALLEHFKPAYEALHGWLNEDMANAGEAGAGSLPNGADYYNERLAFASTTDMTADEIHELGLSEVARIRGEMETLKAKAGFEGTLQEFFAHIRDMPENYFPNTDEGRQAYIDTASAHLDAIKAKLPDYFGLLPQADLIVKRVEAFREQDGAPQHYYPGTPDGSRPGIYYAHLSDMTAMPKNQLEVIAYHEGLPGHHMQIAIAQELEAVPQFRTQAFFNAYVEGWALYSEILALEMGGYEDVLADFGRLTTEIWRAIRLVVDTGIHAKGWSKEEAVAYFMANSPEPEESVRAEVRRYFVIPGQAVSYKIGMLKIQELRAKAEEALGDKFDIRAFHDAVLGGGALPLAILERRIDTWIGEVQSAE